jgi:hypothetical protein
MRQRRHIGADGRRRLKKRGAVADRLAAPADPPALPRLSSFIRRYLRCNGGSQRLPGEILSDQ